MNIPVPCTFKLPGLVNIPQTFRGAAAVAVVQKVSPLQKVKPFLM